MLNIVKVTDFGGLMMCMELSNESAGSRYACLNMNTLYSKLHWGANNLVYFKAIIDLFDQLKASAVWGTRPICHNGEA